MTRSGFTESVNEVYWGISITILFMLNKKVPRTKYNCKEKTKLQQEEAEVWLIN